MSFRHIVDEQTLLKIRLPDVTSHQIDLCYLGYYSHKICDQQIITNNVFESNGSTQNSNCHNFLILNTEGDVRLNEFTFIVWNDNSVSKW